MKQQRKETIGEQLDAINDAIAAAKDFVRVDEVMLWALKYAQANPNAPIAECVQAGLDEWDI